MARLTINISDILDNEMREYVKDNDMTITTFLHLAISSYLFIKYKREEQIDDFFNKNEP